MNSNLTKEQQRIVEKVAYKIDVPIDRLYLLYDLRFNKNLAPSEMEECFGGISKRTIQYYLKQLDWQYNAFEAQQMSATKKDYAEVRKKAYKTIVQNNYSSGNEKDARVLLNALLQERIKNAEVIVGLNNKTAINGLEIDIPVVVITAAGILRYGIEYNAEYWHDRSEVIKKDERKANMMKLAGYNPLIINEYSSAKTQREIGMISEQINSIVELIAADVNRIFPHIAQ